MKNDGAAPSIFDSINARFLRPEQVAKTFVPSDHFRQLSKRGHSLIVGPRGSGKTTLLKMLQGPALAAWEHPEADDYRSRIDFIGVFIPTDVVWSRQIQELGEGYLSPQHQDLFAKAIFTTHILHELAQAIHYRISPPKSSTSFVYRGVTCTADQEAEFVNTLSQQWYLRPSILSLLSLKQALIRRTGEIYEIASKERLYGEGDRDQRLASISFLHIDFLHSVIPALELFNDTFNEEGQRWAFLFDELELAPKYIVRHLFNSLRSTDQRVIFKLSLSPFNENINPSDNALTAMPRNDFSFIQLWYPNKDDGTAFSEALVKSILKEKGIASGDLAEIFGPSLTEEQPRRSDRKSLYKSDMPHVKLFRRLYENDCSFREYVLQNGIDLNHLDRLDENERARWIRKIYSIALVRDAYRVPDRVRHQGREARRRSRKAYPSIYAGAKMLLDMLEGNPRWLIGVMTSLLEEYVRIRKRIDTGRQLDEIRKAASQFKSLLSAMPCDVSARGMPPRSVISILDIIGNQFSKGVVIDKFQPEPVGSFVVDPNTTEQFEKSLAVALNAGAIVYIPGNASQLVVKSLAERRFRLSYLLAPNYQIPVQLMRQTSLSKVLSCGKTAELSLFGEQQGEGSD